ncbi:PilZ domain-containing protein [Bradyrhizobium sp. CCBAU 11386]|uniref:PilZ domain-containing protein n=1 Tax=Bradyrhizobium sp. CCBAU 11386 TaxID=1630837 RepID=UPI0023045AF3|nr:PilZ domain-containing protein [Bradyrhizobium sp. CCBAU 11386]
MSMQEKRRKKRVAFGNWYDTTLIAIDATWSLNAQLHDISDSGAKLHIEGEIPERVCNEEFFLMITPDAKVSRRARTVWRNGSHIGIHFVTAPRSPSRKTA